MTPEEQLIARLKAERRAKRIETVLELSGAALIVAGLALIYVPAAVIVAGAAVLLAAHPIPIRRSR